MAVKPVKPAGDIPEDSAPLKQIYDSVKSIIEHNSELLERVSQIDSRLEKQSGDVHFVKEQILQLLPVMQQNSAELKSVEIAVKYIDTKIESLTSKVDNLAQEYSQRLQKLETL